ncbi:ethanolamine utilization acetate kinase EutQ [Obesumbacterium proteus]|uniref:ethanolamine utilization acetate kinase EutQ n=1 Tax=Obesumbacterium proteus TaxID=82983 RepID=UPI001F2FCACE|nr:ethanolamine utilization acetate kinase EutQ [Obesumbacterium proteus]MCE9883701.1 ethanolamine utilization acetate kinase EutQ [Obesumbacterium proteus]MCE9917870.1 ethanolamine utilization acetate kinase EutQ [Obesumbacterium proteus]MCE9930176.1 ethanolamine utilization acetate kinase EutQ [Obesumbacterium proteus]MCG2878434.1 ethanolamine utilization acetate kinase EutQ [Obesumbacterium proteus]
MKKLITANDIRTAQVQGQKSINIVLADCIVTPEARVVAEQLGVEIIEQLTATPSTPTASANTATDVQAAAPQEGNLAAERQRIREHILAQLPEGCVTETLLAQLIEKVQQEQRAQKQPAAASDSAQPSFRSVTGKGGVKVVDGSSVTFGRFDGAKEHQVGLTDLITAQDGSSMAAGFMQWENGFFPWTLNYDEVDMILEGELHIRHQGETLVGKAGDVMFIPRGSSIEFGTTSHVRFLYVAWPANWQEC